MKSFLSLLIASLLLGCAAQQSFREGQTLAQQGQLEPAINKVREAVRQDPSAFEYRLALRKMQDQLILGLIKQADDAVNEKKWDVAEQTFRRVLLQDSANERAIAGLRQIDTLKRHEVLLSEARAAWDKKETRVALSKLRQILVENPGNRAALALQREWEADDARQTVESSLSNAYKKNISIEFKDVALKTIFEVIARTSGLNFIFDKDVRTDQKATIFLKNSTVEAAVNVVLLTNQLDQRVLDSSTVLIYPNTQAKQREYQALSVRAFYLDSADAKSVANTLKTLLKSRDVVIDEKLNMLILRDSPEAIKLAERLIALHDVPEPEVMLEVEILEVKRSRLLDLGIRWPDQLSLTPLASTTGGALTLRDLRNLDDATTGAAVGATNINAKKQDSDTNILANPRIRTRNKEKAKILIGERVPNITTTSTSTGFVAESINYVDVGLKLDVEPNIYLDNEVAIRVSLEVSNIVNQVQTKSGTLAYQIGTRNAQTVLRLKDGENQVLAGLINDEDRRTANKVPGLGEVPIMGRLFGSQANDRSKTEIVLSITPRIIRNIQRQDIRSLEFPTGTETSLSSNLVLVPAPSLAANTSKLPSKESKPVETQTFKPSTELSKGAETPTAIPNNGFMWKYPETVKVGEVFTLQLELQTDQLMNSLPLAMSFDANAVQILSVSEGDFFKRGNAQTVFTSRIDPTGQILMTMSRNAEPVSGTGVLFSINAKALTPAQSVNLQLTSAAAVSPLGKPVNLSLPAALSIKVLP